ncbi:hypothetical protein RB195_012914 [Necator americanus]
MSCESGNCLVLRARYKTLRPATPFQGDEIVLARHAETIAEVFPDWVERCRLDPSLYQPFDLNVPVRVPRRMNMVQAYQSDPPVSEVGRIMAQLFARELVTRNAIPKAIFCAPSLACLQTAVDIQNFVGKDCGRICVDAALATERNGAAHWLNDKEIAQLKCNVDDGYTPEQSDGNDKSLKNIVEGMKKLAPKLKKNGIVLVITDAFAVKILSELLAGNDIAKRTECKDCRTSAAKTFPPMSSAVVSSQASRNGGQPQVSRIFVRPLTTIGECSRPNHDVVCKSKGY